jgi:hypothetical protein
MASDTASKPFGTVPASALQQPRPFNVAFDEQKLEEMRTLIRLSPVAKETFENRDGQGDDWRFGVPREWMLNAKRVWSEEFDWYVLSLVFPPCAMRRSISSQNTNLL